MSWSSASTLRGRPGPRRDRDHRPARASHDRRPCLRQFDGGTGRGAAPGAGTPSPGPLAARAGNRRYPHGEHSTGLVPRSRRGGGRGLAGGQPRGLISSSWSGSFASPRHIRPLGASENCRCTTSIAIPRLAGQPDHGLTADSISILAGELEAMTRRLTEVPSWAQGHRVREVLPRTGSRTGAEATRRARRPSPRRRLPWCASMFSHRYPARSRLGPVGFAHSGGVLRKTATERGPTVSRPGFLGGRDFWESWGSWRQGSSTPPSCGNVRWRWSSSCGRSRANARGSIARVGERLGVNPETLRNWVERAEIDGGQRPGTTTDDKKRIADLEREIRELRRANEILKAASAYFARELDPRYPR